MAARRSLRVLVVAGLVAVGTGVPSAAADPLECGAVVTGDLLLEADLECGEGDGLVVGADGIVIDLGGHQITKQHGFAGEDVGVRNEGFDRVTITNGSITLFRVGVSLTDGADRNRLTGLDLLDRVKGIEVVDSDRTVIVDNRVEGAVDGWGIHLDGSDHNVVSGNLSRAHVLDGIFLTDSDRNRIIDNELAANFDSGVFVAGGSDRNRIEGNVAYNNDGAGVLVTGAAGEVRGTLVEDNLVFHNTLGILIREGSTGTRVVDNEAIDNSDDGIRIEAEGTKVMKNLAHDNGGWGIWTVEEVIDGPGNTAFDNTVGDCFNLACDG